MSDRHILADTLSSFKHVDLFTFLKVCDENADILHVHCSNAVGCDCVCVLYYC